jgi:hypothetical protein
MWRLGARVATIDDRPRWWQRSPVDPRIWLLLLGGYAPIALLVFAPMSATLARRRNRDAETWLLLGGALGPVALAWIALLPGRPRRDDAERSDRSRRRTPAHRIPHGSARLAALCQLCGEPQAEGHRCRPEVVEDRIQRRWTVRVGGQRILGGF